MEGCRRKNGHRRESDKTVMDTFDTHLHDITRISDAIRKENIRHSAKISALLLALGNTRQEVLKIADKINEDDGEDKV